MKEKGQALIILIVAVAVSLLVLTGALLRSIDQAKASALNRLGKKVYYAAETGAEYGLIKLTRDPSSCSGSDSLTQDSTDITITYSPSGGDCVVTSRAVQSTVVKTISVEASYNSNWIFNYSSWAEIP